MKDYNPTIVDLMDIPDRRSFRQSLWRRRFAEIPTDKAVMLKYNTRQRAHQVANLIRTSARHHGFRIYTRVIHAEPAIHHTDGWLLYWWKATE